MDHVFLDANVLWSASYKKTSGLRKLWELDVVLLTSSYALQEATRNAKDADQLTRLNDLEIELVPEAPERLLPGTVGLPEGDDLILRTAIEAKATHLLTGDWRHFGPYFRQTIGGVFILPPREYLDSLDV